MKWKSVKIQGTPGLKIHGYVSLVFWDKKNCFNRYLYAQFPVAGTTGVSPFVPNFTVLSTIPSKL